MKVQTSTSNLVNDLIDKITASTVERVVVRHRPEKCTPSLQVVLFLLNRNSNKRSLQIILHQMMRKLNRKKSSIIFIIIIPKNLKACIRAQKTKERNSWNSLERPRVRNDNSSLNGSKT
jgi:hypothetical protein